MNTYSHTQKKDKYRFTQSTDHSEKLINFYIYRTFYVSILTAFHNHSEQGGGVTRGCVLLTHPYSWQVAICIIKLICWYIMSAHPHPNPTVLNPQTASAYTTVYPHSQAAEAEVHPSTCNAWLRRLECIILYSSPVSHSLFPC